MADSKAEEDSVVSRKAFLHMFALHYYNYSGYH